MVLTLVKDITCHWPADEFLVFFLTFLFLFSTVYRHPCRSVTMVALDRISRRTMPLFLIMKPHILFPQGAPKFISIHARVADTFPLHVPSKKQFY
jgi:hypothetical protein